MPKIENSTPQQAPKAGPGILEPDTLRTTPPTTYNERSHPPRTASAKHKNDSTRRYS